MLGLRSTLLSRRSRASFRSNKSTEDVADNRDMEVTGRQESIATPVKPNVDVKVNELSNSDSDQSPTQQKDAFTNGHSNGHPPVFSASSGSVQITRVIENTKSLKGRIVCELDDVDEEYFNHTTFSSYVEYIADERLMHMPRRGSKWDRVLKAAEFFGYQIYNLGSIVAYFVPESHSIALSALASCRLLLELGHNQAQALEPTFSTLYELGLLVAKTIQRREYFAANEAIKEDIADVYSDLVGLVGDIAIYYRLRLNSMTSESVTIDFDGAFGKTIDRIWAKKEHLSNHIWRYKLRQKRYSLDIEAIRAKLSPADDSLKTLLYGRLADKSERLEGTCEWIQPYLLDFFRGTDSSMTITGAAGCGKSMLAGWIVERLRRQLGRKSYETITHTFAGDAPAEATPIAFLKNVLFQLLERNVGDAKFYETIVKAYEDYSSHNDLHKLETSLWIALEAGLKTVDEQKVNLVIIIDGLDEILGRGESAAQLHKRLHEHVDKFSHTRAITLSRPVSHLGGTGSMHLVITPDHNHDDVVAYYRHRLTKFQHFKSQSHATAEKFIEGLMAKAKGSFLEPYLASKILATENSYDGFFRSGNNMPHDVHGLLSDLIKRSWDLQNATTRHLVAFMLASERPLTIAEMEDLLSINLEKRTINSHGNLRKHITFHCSGLIVERKGLIRFKHSSIRNYFKNELSGKSLMSMKEAHAELTKRLLFYAKHTLTVSYEPSFEIISGSVIHDSFHSHGLLEYVIRNWIGHFRSSTFCHAKDELNLSAEFKEIFPDSVFFAMIEWSCWQNQYTITEATHLHDLTLRIRTACFGEKHRSVLQSLIILGSIHRSSTNLITAAEFFYRASCIGQVVLHKFSTVVVSCTHIFLTCTESIVIKERTKIVNYREEMIIFMIEICKTKHGKDSDQVIKWYEILAELYVATKEEHRAVVIYKELYDIVVIRFGKSHPRCRHVAETLGGLKVVLKDGEDQKDVVKYDEFIFETCDEMDESDELRISIILRLCHTYERAGKWILAEKLYINLWRRISELCRIKATVELHIAKINIAIAYLRFLEKTKRTEEATNILICLWAEYEHHSFESETIIIRLKEIGVLCKSFGLLTIAVSVLSKVWGWFKGKGKTDHEEAISTTILITEVVEEVVKTITITKKTTQTTTIITETITREVFETTYERCKRGKVDGHFFKACIALVSLYIKLEKWSECEIVIKKSLELTWKSILTIDAKVTLSGAFVKECVLVATQLAICYHRQKYFEKAEELYLRIYRACLQSFKIDHECVTESAMVLIRFYEEYHRHDKVIEIYIELLNGYKKHCGVAHKLTIRTLYALGSICLTLGRKDAYDYYIEIVTVLNKGGHCHHDAFEAALIVCQYYYETQKWVELRKICVTLWETFIHHHNEFKFTEAMIITLYERYVYVLEFHAKVEFSVLYKISLEYRETVTKHFGASAAIVITAMIALAKVCEKHEEHWHESVTIYEEVIKRTKTITTMTTETIETITITAKKRLSKVYITIITKGKSTTTTTFEKALAICLETYEHLKIEFGCWHEKTLIQLKEIVIIYKKLESYTTIIRMLEVAVVEIITKTKKSIDLYHAAATLASIYISMGMAKQGHELLHQLRHLIVLRDFASSTEITIKLGSNVSKVAFVFLIAFEQGLVEKVVCSYSEVMADIILETYLYEQYTSIIKTETRIEVILEVSARLRSFWFSHGRKGHCEVLDKKLFAIFKTKYGSYIKTQDDITFIFYVALLTELSKDRSTVDFGHICCITSYQKVKSLVEAGDFIKAHEVAKCSFQLIKSQKWYHSMQNIAYGYKVAELLAGIDCRKPTDKRIHENMLETSRQIVIEVLASCRAAKINFVSLRFEDVAGLVRLLGDQENYGELEFLLEELWHSREVQNNWSIRTVLSIGRSLVHAHYAAGHLTKAIDLCDRLCYNLRHSHGWLAPETLSASKLLAELYTATHRYREAMGVHEEILREIDEDASVSAENKEPENKILQHKGDAQDQVELLKRAHQRLGGWSKSERSYRDLFSRLERFKLRDAEVGKWSNKNADELGKYHVPREWYLVPGGRKEDVTTKRPGISKAAARRSYGAGLTWNRDEVEVKRARWEGEFVY